MIGIIERNCLIERLKMNPRLLAEQKARLQIAAEIAVDAHRPPTRRINQFHPASKAIFKKTLKRYRRDIAKIKEARLDMDVEEDTPLIDRLLAGEEIKGCRPCRAKFVFYDNTIGKWIARVYISKDLSSHVGCFREHSDAIEARDKFLEKNGFVLDSDQKLCIL